MFNNANQQAPKRENRTELEGGAATTEITPRSSQFLSDTHLFEGTAPACTTLC